jgi:hypothetical protein
MFVSVASVVAMMLFVMGYPWTLIRHPLSARGEILPVQSGDPERTPREFLDPT